MAGERQPTFIVGIGASAGGVEALGELLRATPADTGFGFVVVTHAEAGRESMLADILGRSTAMPVREARDGESVLADQVYIVPAGRDAALAGGTLRLSRTVPSEAAHHPIDTFLESLAQDQGERAIAVILSGAGSDGTLGVRAVKEAGGLTVAQTANGTAPRHAAMPQSAIATGLVDLPLPVEAIPAKLVDYAARFAAASGTDDERQAASARKAREAICEVLRERVGHDFGGYKEKTFLRRVQRRMQVLQLVTLDAYVEHLRQDPEEARLLFRDLLIGVTHFFRDAEAFQALEELVIPRLFADKAPGGTLRVWVPGCSTGEEVYSIALLLREHMDAMRSPPKVQIFGTDIDEAALQVARAGRYPAALLDSVPEERRQRFFHRDGGTLTRREAGAGPVRVLLAQRRPRPALLAARPDLLPQPPDLPRVGAAGPHHPGVPLRAAAGRLPVPRQRGERLAPRRPVPAARQEAPPVPAPRPRPARSRSCPRSSRRRGRGPARQAPAGRSAPTRSPCAASSRATSSSVSRRRTWSSTAPARSSTTRRAPAGTSRRPPASRAARSWRRRARGCASTSAPRSRRRPRRGARSGARASRWRPRAARCGPSTSRSSRCRPGTAIRLFLVLFDRVGPSAANGAERDDPGGRALPHEHAEREVGELRDRLQGLVEEYETALEELKAANEELVVHQRGAAVDQRGARDQQGGAAVGQRGAEHGQPRPERQARPARPGEQRPPQPVREHPDRGRVPRPAAHHPLFTPALTGLFSLIPTDVGRPLADIAARVRYPDLHADLRRVLASGEPVERRVSREDADAHYLARLLPYRDSGGAADGVIATFVDITGLVEGERQQRTLVDELNHRVRNMLTVVGAIASQTLQHAASPEAFADAFIGRIEALGRAYGLVARERWGDVALEEVVREELEPVLDGNEPRIAITGPAVLLRPKAAVPLGMVLHELVTNAVKYGALSVPVGRLAIEWTAEDGPGGKRLVLRWTEAGLALPNGPGRKGFGTELIEREIPARPPGRGRAGPDAERPPGRRNHSLGRRVVLLRVPGPSGPGRGGATWN